MVAADQLRPDQVGLDEQRFTNAEGNVKLRDNVIPKYQPRWDRVLLMPETTTEQKEAKNRAKRQIVAEVYDYVTTTNIVERLTFVDNLGNALSVEDSQTLLLNRFNNLHHNPQNEKVTTGNTTSRDCQGGGNSSNHNNNDVVANEPTVPSAKQPLRAYHRYVKCRSNDLCFLSSRA